tara:strand:- start:150 stop:710 length:561 start_codon:yes stop_codon:yes gene_type:complete
MKIITTLFAIINLFLSIILPSYASRITDSYDGNIFPIYAGNGSIVPPQTTLKESIKNKRVSLLFFYLDDSSDSKALAPIISGLDLIWRNNIDIIALTTDELQNNSKFTPEEEGYYWNGYIPQTVVIDDKGDVRFDKNGLIDIDKINKVISEIKNIDLDDQSFSVEIFNEYNSTISENKDNKLDQDK